MPQPLTKASREARDVIEGIIKPFPGVRASFEESKDRSLKVDILAPNGDSRCIKVKAMAASRNPAMRKDMLTIVRRALCELKIIQKEEKTMPAAEGRVLKDFRDIRPTPARDIDVDTTPQPVAKPNGNGHHAPERNKTDPYDYTEAQKLRSAGLPLREIEQKTGISKAAISQNTMAAGGDVAKPRVQLTHAEVFKLGGILMACCSCGLDGNATYAEGWDDARVAKETSERCTHEKVREFRIEQIGRLESEQPKTPADMKAVMKELRELKARVQALEEAATKP